MQAVQEFHAAGAVTRGRVAERGTLAAAVLGASMIFIDLAAVNVALPALQKDLGATINEAQWVFEVQALFLSSLILVGGSLGDRFGRRRAFLLGIAGFAAASLACGLAASTAQLIAARAVQGIAAALLLPGSLALLAATFGEARRGRAIGTWVALCSITATGGSILAFQLVDRVSWRGVFFLSLPLGLSALVIARRSVPAGGNGRGRGDFDGTGALLATLGLGGMTFGLVESSRLGWSDPRVPGALAVGVAALAGFVWAESRARAPMMPLSLFRSRAFTGACLVQLWLDAAFRGALFILPFYLIQVHGYSATAAGTAFLAVPLLMFLFSRWAGGMVDRFGARRLLISGSLLEAAGFALLALPLPAGGYWMEVFPASVALGAGMALTGAPVDATALGAVEEGRAGIAAGVINAVARGAALLGVAALGAMVVSLFSLGLEHRLDAIGLPPEARLAVEAQRQKMGALEIPASLGPVERDRVREAVRQSFVDGFRGMMLAAAGLSLLGALSAWWLIGRPTIRLEKSV